MPGDRISHLQAGGLHLSPLSREHQGITMAKMRARIHPLQPGCVFAKGRRQHGPVHSPFFFSFLKTIMGLLASYVSSLPSARQQKPKAE